MPSVVQFTQTAPDYSIVCPGDRLVLTCIVTETGGAIVWQRDSTERLLLTSGPLNGTLDSFFVNINESNSTTLISTAIDNNVSVTLDRTNVTCLADGANAKRFTINVASNDFIMYAYLGTLIY